MAIIKTRFFLPLFHTVSGVRYTHTIHDRLHLENSLLKVLHWEYKTIPSLDSE